MDSLNMQYSSASSPSLASGDCNGGYDHQQCAKPTPSVPAFGTLDSSADLVASRLAAMRRQESGTAYRPLGDTLGALTHRQSPGAEKSCKRPVDITCRTKMVDWCFTISDYCRFNRNVVPVAFSFLDRFVATDVGSCILYDRNRYQLASMTALYTAVKINEPEVIGPDTIAELSRGNYSKAEVLEMEADMLSALGWRMNPPTAVSFLMHFFTLLPIISLGDGSAREELLNCAKSQSELAVRDYDLSAHVRPSVVAYASLLNTLAEVDYENSCDESGVVAFLNVVGAVAGIDEINLEMLEEVRRKLLVAYTGDVEVEIPRSPSFTASSCSSSAASVTQADAVSKTSSWSASAPFSWWRCYNSSPRCVSQGELR